MLQKTRNLLRNRLFQRWHLVIIIYTNLSEKSPSDEPEAVVDRELILHDIILDNTERKHDGERLAGGMKTTFAAKEEREATQATFRWNEDDF